MNSGARTIVKAISLMMACLGLTSHAYCESRLDQQKLLGKATSQLLSAKVGREPDATIRASAVGMLMEFSAKVEHLGDIEELLSIVKEPAPQRALKRKLEIIQRFYFGHSCETEVNSLSAYMLVVHEADLAANLQATKVLISSICATARAR